MFKGGQGNDFTKTETTGMIENMKMLFALILQRKHWDTTKKRPTFKSHRLNWPHANKSHGCKVEGILLRRLYTLGKGACANLGKSVKRLPPAKAGNRILNILGHVTQRELQ